MLFSCLNAYQVFIFFRSCPPTPPSHSTEVTIDAARLDGSKQATLSVLKILLKRKDFLILLFAFGITTGGTYSVSTVLESSLTDGGYGPSVSSIGGIILIISGIVGACKHTLSQLKLQC